MIMKIIINININININIKAAADVIDKKRRNLL